jgi:hypothetical protein
MSKYLLLPCVELEFRFGTFNNKKFDSSIDKAYFKTINSALEKDSWKYIQKTHTIDYYEGNTTNTNKKIRLTELCEPNGNDSLYSKENVVNNIFELKTSPFDIRLSVNQEFNLNSYINLFDKKESSIVTREKFRHSYIQDEFKYDLTYVIQKKNNIQQEKYEMELEILQTVNSIEWSDDYLNDFIECKIYDILNIVEPNDRKSFKLKIF